MEGYTCLRVVGLEGVRGGFGEAAAVKSMEGSTGCETDLATRQRNVDGNRLLLLDGGVHDLPSV